MRLVRIESFIWRPRCACTRLRRVNVTPPPQNSHPSDDRITCYVVGLVGCAAKGLASVGWPVNVELAMALSIPVVALVAILGVRHVRRVVSKAAR